GGGGGERRRVDIEGVYLRGERCLSVVAVEPPPHRAVERLERRLETPGRAVDRGRFAHAPPRLGAGTARPVPSKSFAWQYVTNRTLRGPARPRQRRVTGFQRSRNAPLLARRTIH